MHVVVGMFSEDATINCAKTNTFSGILVFLQMIARPSPSTAAWTGQNRLEHKCFKVQFFHIYDTSANLFPGMKPPLNIVLVPSRSPSTMSPRRHAAVTLLCYHVDEHARLAAAVWQQCSSWQGNGQRWGRVTARCVRTLTQFTQANSLLKAQQAGVCVHACVCVLRQC